MDRRQTSRWKSVVQLLSLAVLLLTIGGCGPQRPASFGTVEAPLVWPEPPDPARIMYLGSVSTETDMERTNSWSEGFGELLFGKNPVGVLVSPYAIAVDSSGVMFVADSGGAAVHAFDLRTRDYRQFSSLSEGGELQKPVGLAIFQDRLYVADSVLRQVCVFKKNGAFLFAFGAERLTRPAGIACHPEGALYVADTAAHTLHVFDADGTFTGSIGMRGIGPGQFNFPTHLWIDHSGQLYVSDTLNYRIQVFAPDGRFLMTFGQQGDRPGNFAHPCGVATDAFGNIYVTDRQFENVQVFDREGHILMAFGQEGDAPGEFWLPAGLFISDRNRIYVADSYNKRVQIFDLLEGGEYE